MIKTLRISKGMTQKDVATRVSMAQSNISKIENAALPVAKDDLLRIAAVLNAADDQVDDLLAQFELTLKSALSYQVVQADGVEKKQQEIAKYEGAASHISQYEPTIIPGLLQVADYARAIMRRLDVPPSDVEGAVYERILRQKVLLKSSHNFHFILSETSLYTSPGGEATQIEQLESILLHVGRRNTRLGIIPVENGTDPAAMTGFVLFDSNFATAETTIAEQEISDGVDISYLVRLHGRLENKAVYGQGAVTLIREAVSRFESDLIRVK